MNVNKRYDLDVEQDVLKDRIENVCRIYMVALRGKGLSLKNNPDHPLAVKCKKAIELSQNVYNFDTYGKIDEAETRMTELWKYCNEFL